MHNNGLVIFDRFSLENANMVVFAKSGAGKSFTVKLEALRSMMVGADIVIIDPENEYQKLCDAVGGSYNSIELKQRQRGSIRLICRVLLTLMKQMTHCALT